MTTPTSLVSMVGMTPNPEICLEHIGRNRAKVTQGERLQLLTEASSMQEPWKVSNGFTPITYVEQRKRQGK